jgi:hypothetical protein
MEKPVKKVYNEYVIIRRDEGSKQVGAIELLDQSVEQPFSGVVVCSFDEAQIPDGAHILYQRNAAQPVTIDGELYWVLRKVDVICEL